jgi:hypothetical protein
MMRNDIVQYSKQVPLTQGYFAEVSYHWYEFLIQWKWHLVRDGRGRCYASHSFRIKNRHLFFKMHRFILGLFNGDKRIGDHKDHNGLNNTTRNLRIANETQNCINTLSRKNSTSKYLGVSIRITKRKKKNHKYWVAQITVFKNKMYIGIFPYTPEGEIEAAKAYDKKAKQHFGEFSNLNFPEIQGNEYRVHSR